MTETKTELKTEIQTIAYYLDPAGSDYRQVLFDVVRIFYPQFQWAESPAEGELLQVSFGDSEAVLQAGDECITFSVEGQDENQRRRLLKKEFYHLLKRSYQGAEPPWGIMTGIRPTKIVHRYHDAGLADADIRRELQNKYMLQPEKADLLLEVTERQRPFLLTPQEARESVSLYLSIPFCPTRCAYCSFPSFCLPKPQLQEQYLDHLLAEYRAVVQALQQRNRHIQTVYIGGGTPTSLSEPQLEHLLAGMTEALQNGQPAEFTVEAGRPDTITPYKLQILHDYGVGRISINPQTFSQKTLDRIGRRHTVTQLLEAYKLARSIGFDSINMDLIAGLPGETPDDFAETLDYIAKLQPENLTVHTLAIKRTAALQLDEKTQQQDANVRRMYELMRSWLATQDYVPYYLYRQKHMIGDQENTGYCLPGKESLYNIQMMEERQTIFGLGVGSTSKYVHPEDWTLEQGSNPKDLFYYNERIDEIIAKKLARINE